MSVFTICLYLILPIITVGCLFLFLKIKPLHLNFLLAFSASYLFTITIVELLPSVFANSNDNFIKGIAIVGGFFFQTIIEAFSNGFEHGHLHSHSVNCKKHIPISLIIGLYLHSYLEGFPIFIPELGQPLESSNGLLSAQQSILFSVITHNIPLTAAFVTLLLEHQLKKQIVLIFICLFALMAPFAGGTYLLFQNTNIQSLSIFNEVVIPFIIGVFLHTSTTILFESADNHKYQLPRVIVIVVGVCCGIIFS